MKHSLPSLNYGYKDVEPFVDALTMEIHHSKHHQGYVDKLNTALEGSGLEEKSLEEILKTPDLDDAIKNNAGGHHNHSLFWEILDPAKKLDIDLSSIKEEFSSVALSRFGSGWAWLVENEKGEKEIYSLPNQDSPLSLGHKPLLGLDV
tara:strand:+ start:619 stop:1062 length:444 start_codon:yes stop_codon:yes gene_type:complete